MKDWLTIIIVLLIIGIVLDGLRRMRIAKRESITLSRNAKKADQEAPVPVSTSEFPSGGARVAAHREIEGVQNINETVKKKFDDGKSTRSPQVRNIPEQVSLNLEEAVPMLMDSVEDSMEEEPARAMPELNAQQSADNTYKDALEPTIGSLEDLQDDDVEVVEDEIDSDVSVEVRAPVKRATKTQSKVEVRKQASTDTQEKELEEPDEVLIINVMAKPEQRIQGELLLEALVGRGLKLGEMDIFHRHQNDDGDGPIVFSLANMVVPGTFNLAKMDEFETPGVSLFLSLPVVGESIAAYEDMVATAKSLAETLDGELKDENRSVMTSQTIEHGRQRVIEFERKRKLHA